MAFKVGRDCKVTLGTSTIVGMGMWSMDGISADQLETTSFGDYWKKYEFGINDGGNISFGGLADPADVTGQVILQAANLNKSDITNMRLYVDSTSYYEPCQTTGYFAPGAFSTGYETIKSHVNITSYSVKSDKSGLVSIDFQAKVSGVMVLV
jgi:hypothetical protein